MSSVFPRIDFPIASQQSCELACSGANLDTPATLDILLCLSSVYDGFRTDSPRLVGPLRLEIERMRNLPTPQGSLCRDHSMKKVEQCQQNGCRAGASNEHDSVGERKIDQRADPNGKQVCGVGIQIQ